MAVATPVLERKIEETQEEVRFNAPVQTADEIHNARISEIYAKLIKPDTKMSDLKPAAPAYQAQEQSVQAPVQQVVQPVAPAQPVSRFVEGARTDAAIFRADSAINRKVSFVQAEDQPVMAAQQIVTEEENEDLRPTSTTMQYTAENKQVDVEGTVVNASAQKRISLTKRDKIVIAVVVSVIVALFALIIINSAIISNLNSDLSSLQNSLKVARNVYDRVTNEVSEYESSFEDTLRALAESFGMVK